MRKGVFIKEVGDLEIGNSFPVLLIGKREIIPQNPYRNSTLIGLN